MFSFFTKSDSEHEEQVSENEELVSENEEQVSDNEDSQTHTSESEEVEQKSMADYYDDLEAVIANIREEIKDADKDPSFRHAAKVLTKVIGLCRNIESIINPVTVMQTNNERSTLLKTLGPGGLIEIKGEASKLLVTHYRNLMIALANKEYWPKAPWGAAAIVNARYASELGKRADETQRRIQEYQKRIDAYEKSKTKEQPVETPRRRR